MKHRLALLFKDSSTQKTTDCNMLYGWGDDTYGELGEHCENVSLNIPRILQFFKSLKILQISTGARHSVVIDKDNNMYCMGDNSEDQCAISARRAPHPVKILKDIQIEKIFSGENHNFGLGTEKG